jgi:hypothetical protein
MTGRYARARQSHSAPRGRPVGVPLRADNDLFSVAQKVTRVSHQSLVPIHSLRNSNLISHVLPHIDWEKMYAAVLSNCDDMHSILVDNQCCRGNYQRGFVMFEDKLHLPIHAVNQRSITVVDLNLCQHRSSRKVHRFSTSCHGCRIHSARSFLYSDGGLLSISNGWASLG